ncbi:MAG TPA: hypothetical protein VMV71_04195 [Candidatus Paceibacterota bacterium]|nr:hypothetical protein [Candidatus Paceibacterota bacterium]
MLNPAEDIVNVWLQEVCDHFVMNNIVVRKETRLINGRNIGGGRGKEIDFLSTNGRGDYYWVEVSVSPNPRLPSKAVRSKEAIDIVLKKFASEKEAMIKKRFDIKTVNKWFVYSHKLFSKKLGEEKVYCHALEKQGIKAIGFEKILREVFKKLDYMGYDTPRQYLFLLKKFGYKNSNQEEVS